VNIVDRFALTIGDGKSTTKHGIWHGETETTFNINTYVVNHCNGCGNEWEKYRTKYINKTQIVQLALKYFAKILLSPKQKNNDWMVDTVGGFKDVHLETMLELVHIHRKSLDKRTRSTITRKRLLEEHCNPIPKKKP
jgi:hypothetical protein